MRGKDPTRATPGRSVEATACDKEPVIVPPCVCGVHVQSIRANFPGCRICGVRDVRGKEVDSAS